MKSPLKKSIGEVVTDYGAKVMKLIKEGLLGRSLFDFYGDVKALTFRTKEVTTVPTTPPESIVKHLLWRFEVLLNNAQIFKIKEFGA